MFTSFPPGFQPPYVTTYDPDVEALDYQFQKWLLEPPSASPQDLKAVASQLTSLTFPQFRTYSSTASESKFEGRRSSLSDREPVVLSPNPRPLQIACLEPSSDVLDNSFVAESAAPFDPGVVLAATRRMLGQGSRRTYGFSAPCVRPMATPKSPEKLSLAASAPPVFKTVRPLNFEEDIPLVSPKRVCSVVTFRV